MRVVYCTRPIDTYLGETRLHIRYLVLKEWSIEHNTGHGVAAYQHYGIFLNTGAYYDLFIDRFADDRMI